MLRSSHVLKRPLGVNHGLGKRIFLFPNHHFPIAEIEIFPRVLQSVCIVNTTFVLLQRSSTGLS